MSSALNMEMREVEKALLAANAAVTREEWAEAKRALAEVQDRVAVCCARWPSSNLSSACGHAEAG